MMMNEKAARVREVSKDSGTNSERDNCLKL